jgi:hypothetical protein
MSTSARRRRGASVGGARLERGSLACNSIPLGAVVCRRVRFAHFATIST